MQPGTDYFNYSEIQEAFFLAKIEHGTPIMAQFLQCFAAQGCSTYDLLHLVRLGIRKAVKNPEHKDWEDIDRMLEEAADEADKIERSVKHLKIAS